MKLVILVAICITTVSPALANIKFGVIHPTQYRAGASMPPGQGFSLQTTIVANLGTSSLNLRDFLLTSTLVSSTTPVNPLISQTEGTNIVLAPGQAYGYINGDFNQDLTLAFVQSIFPTVTNVIVDSNNGFNLSFSNPTGSGVVFQNTQTVVNYQLSVGGVMAQWTMNYVVGDPNLSPGITSGTLGHVESIASSDESADVLLDKFALTRAQTNMPMIYGMLAKNFGPNVASNVVIVDTLPIGTTLLAAFSSRGSCSRNGIIVTCNIGTLGNRGLAGVVLMLRVNAPAGTTLVNSAQATSSTRDNVPSNNADTVRTKVVRH
jgi:uncharacterized repeat protein (TIGR01451 family)